MYKVFKQGLTKVLGSHVAVSLSYMSFSQPVLIPSMLPSHLPVCFKASVPVTLLSLNWYKVAKLVPNMEN